MSVESKITPMVLEKFRELAASFDDELIDKDVSEREATRLLSATHVELSQIREEYRELTYQAQNSTDDDKEAKEAELAQLEKIMLSLIEQQQQLQLLSRAQHEESKQNGHMGQADDAAERAMLAQMLNEEQTKRQNLVGQYQEALSIAGPGEKGEQYRRLISKCVGTEVESMDENIDNLLEQLLDDQGGVRNELHAEPLL